MIMRTLLAAAATLALAAPAFAQPPAAAPATPAAAAAPAAAAPAAAGEYTEDQRLATFTANDKNKDEKISPEEYKGILKALNQDEGLADQIFPLRDTNMDGFISKQEFATPLAQ